MASASCPCCSPPLAFRSLPSPPPLRCRPAAAATPPSGPNAARSKPAGPPPRAGAAWSIEAAVESLLLSDRRSARAVAAAAAAARPLPGLPPSSSAAAAPPERDRAARLPREPAPPTLADEAPGRPRAPPGPESAAPPALPARGATPPVQRPPPEPRRGRPDCSPRGHFARSEAEFMRSLAAAYASTSSAEGRAFVRVGSVCGPSLSRLSPSRAVAAGAEAAAAAGRPMLYWLVGCDDQVACCRPVPVHGDHAEFNEEFTVPVRRWTKAVAFKLVATGAAERPGRPASVPAAGTRCPSVGGTPLARKPVAEQHRRQPPPTPFRRQVGDVVVGRATVPLAGCGAGQEQLVGLLRHPRDDRADTASLHEGRAPPPPPAETAAAASRLCSRVLGAVRRLPAVLPPARRRSVACRAPETTEPLPLRGRRADHDFDPDLDPDLDLDADAPVAVAQASVSVLVWPFAAPAIAGPAPASYEECRGRIGDLWNLDGLMKDVSRHFAGRDDGGGRPPPRLGQILDSISRLGSAKFLGNPSVRMGGCMYWKQRSCVLCQQHLLFFAVSSNPNHSIFQCALDLSLATGVDGPGGPEDRQWYPPENGFCVRFGGGGGGGGRSLGRSGGEVDYAEFSLPTRADAERWVAVVKNIARGLAPA